MPSQFQPYYPHPPQPAAAPAARGQQASDSKGGIPLDQLLKAIQKQKAGQQLLDQPPDDLGTLADEGLIAQINQSPSAIDNLGVLNDESLIPASYY